MHAIYCAGEQGEVVLDILRNNGVSDNVVFLDENTDLHGNEIEGVPIIGDITAVDRYDKEFQFIVAYGDRQGVRLDIAKRIEDVGYDFFSALHSDTTISETATLGKGVTVNARSYLGPDVHIGDHVLVDSCVNISHDVELKPGATITPNATLAGGVSIGRDAYVGPGATIVEDVTIGPDVLVGAGAVVIESVDKGTTVGGIPAEPL